MAGKRGIDLSVIPTLFNVESTWNPQEGKVGGNYGIAQMAPGDFTTAGGTRIVAIMGSFMICPFYFVRNKV